MKKSLIFHSLFGVLPFILAACMGESNSKSINIDENEAFLDTDSTLTTSSSMMQQKTPSNNMSYGNLFQGDEIEFNVKTGFEEDETAGHWYIINDNNIGGKSSVTFPIPLKFPDNFDENISYCNGFCDTVKIKGNISTPFAGVGFNLVNKNGKGADISSWGGITIKYVATKHPLTIALIPEGVTDMHQFYHYDLPACPGHRAIHWSEFVQVDERAHKRNKEEDLKHISAIQFIVGGIDGDENFIKIISLGTFYLQNGELPFELTQTSSSFYTTLSSSDFFSSSSSLDNVNNTSSNNILISSSSSQDSSLVYSSDNNNQSSNSITFDLLSSNSTNTYQ